MSAKSRRAGPSRGRSLETPRRETLPAREQLEPWIRRLGGARVLVWGDFVLDEYWRCLSRRVSREAPVLILDYQSRAVQAGGAANAAMNLAALGAEVHAVGPVGDDEAGNELRAELERRGVSVAGLLERRREATVVKTRIVAGSQHTALQQVVRVDRGKGFRWPAAERARLERALSTAVRGAKAVVLSDYGYDSVTPSLASRRTAAWRAAGVTVALDARYRLRDYAGVTLATPNESEAAAAAGFEIRDLRDLARAARRLQTETAVEHLLVTRGRDGLTWWDAGRGIALDAWGPSEAVDVTGAGDAVVAAATLALTAGASPPVAAAIANLAGAVAVSHRGAVAVTRNDLIAMLAQAQSGRAAPRPAKDRRGRR